jgi:hypothetical protein
MSKKSPAGVIAIANNLTISAIEYASQGNSIIGIRGSGKTYGAGKIAEGLLDNNIPIVVFDPTGVWQNLRNGINGNPGYPVVVVGGLQADIPLSKQTVLQVLGAAMEAGISLVFDFMGLSSTSKSEWLRIVSACVEYMVLNNHKYEVRHVFIEEAAEFVPQKPQFEGKVAYSRIESMARTGRNQGLGYTLINQRAEEIAKAIFEISEQVLVFRQAGKNSLKSIGHWFDFRGLTSGKEITNTLPRLEDGECWVINNSIEKRIKVLPKTTFHPNPKERKNTLPTGTKIADRTAFIQNITQALQDAQPKPAATKAKPVANQPSGNNVPVVAQATASKPVDTKAMGKYINQLEKENAGLKEQLKVLHTFATEQAAHLQEIYTNITPLVKLKVPAYTQTLPVPKPTALVNPTALPLAKQSGKAEKPLSTEQITSTSLGKAERAILTVLAMYYPKPVNRNRVGLLAEFKITGGHFKNVIGKLYGRGLIDKPSPDQLTITPAGINDLGEFKPLPSAPVDLVKFWTGKLGSAGGAMLNALFSYYPSYISREQLAMEVNMVSTAGHFKNVLGKLRICGLINEQSKQVRLAEIFYTE